MGDLLIESLYVTVIVLLPTVKACFGSFPLSFRTFSFCHCELYPDLVLSAAKELRGISRGGTLRSDASPGLSMIRRGEPTLQRTCLSFRTLPPCHPEWNEGTH